MGGNFNNFLFGYSAHQSISEKESSLKGKNLLPKRANYFLVEQTTFQRRTEQFRLSCFPESVSIPKGSKFFPFRADPVSEGDRTVLTELPPLKVYQFPKGAYELKSRVLTT